MEFVHYDLQQLRRGQVVEVTLDSAANVLLLDSAKFNSYRSGQRYHYYGGHVTRSPHRVPVPQDGHWHVVIDLGGQSGQVRSAARVLPGLIPPTVS
jgi:hypothetical protein